MAVKVQPVDSAEKDPETGADITVRRMVTKQYIAAGRAAREFEDTADVMVFSPLRDGQIAQYSATIYLLRSLSKRMLTKFQLFRPVLCIRAQERITEVEEKALIDAGIQLGARKVYLYKGSLSVLLSDVPKWLRNGYIIHIEPQE